MTEIGRQGTILVVQHERECPPALLGRWLADAGASLDLRRPFAGDPLPPSLHRHCGLLVLGGHMGAHDDDRYPWLGRVKALFRDAADRQVPALGVCLGHQLAAVGLGGDVRRNPRGRQQGLHPVGWTADAATDPLLGPLSGPRRGVQWNDDVVTRLPEGTTVLASTPRGEVQAARFADTVWGVQLHPEADAEVVAGWVALDPGAAAEHDLASVAAAASELDRAWRPLADAFAAISRVAPRRSEPA